MPIQQNKKQDYLEKRLKLLRSQVYGKSTLTFKTSGNKPSQNPSNSSNDISYLQKDLFKTLVLASASLGIQFLIFFLLQKKLINLSF